jgi:5-methylcytosine-specific restriction protein A
VEPGPFSTRKGYVNENAQEVLGPTGLPGTDHGQKIYVLKCGRCAREYGANGTDIAGRRCPYCGGGRPGFDVSAAHVTADIAADKPRSARNPAWTRDELILALDVYFELPSPDQHHPAVIALSELLNRLWASTEFGGATTLRNPSGVSMKLSNFQRFDPAFQDSGRKGLAHGGKGDEEVWTEFANDRQRLKAVAAAIRAALNDAPIEIGFADQSPDIDAAEGAVLSRMHHYRERNSALAQRKKEQALAQRGRLSCEVCDFDFEQAYGPRGAGYIEVHHTKALESLRPGDRTKLSELAVLCANCHRIVHAKRPWLTLDELRALVRG